MNPKDMTGRALFIASKDSYSSKKQHAGISLLNWIKDQEAIELELLRRLDESDVLRKENKELRKESFALYARLNEYSYQFIYGGRSGVRTAYVLAAPVLASYRLSHPDGFDAKEIEARS